MLRKSIFLGVTSYLYSQYDPQCCGIIGVISTNGSACNIIFEGVQLLQNRGYDSAGMGTVNKSNQLTITKFASDQVKKVDCFVKLQAEIKKHMDAIVGIGHTRWATCGGKTDQNAHPHCDQYNRIALVHNGTLENYVELKVQLKEKGVQFNSETDSEVIAQMIGVNLHEGMELLPAVENVLEQLDGQWGLAIIDKENPNQLVVCRQGSPLLVGYGEDCIFVASEKIAFEKYTQNYIALQDGEVMLLNLANKDQLFNQVKHRLIFNEHQQYEKVHTTPKPPYKTFFEMEIYEQPNSLLRCLGNGARLAGVADCSKLGGLELKYQELIGIKHLLLFGCGSSFNAALAVVPIFRAYRVFETVQAIEASEFQLHDLPQGYSGAIFISQSGETKDLVKVLNQIKQMGVITIGVVNVVGSLIASTVDCGVYLNCGREVAVAASKSFSSQLVGLILISLWFSYQLEKANNSTLKQQSKREKYVNQLRLLPMVVGQALVECESQLKDVVTYLSKQQHIVILGKGSSYAIAREGALKLKELTYIHAEAFCAGELKHGPLALIDQEKKTPVILIILNNDYLSDMKLALNEVHSRNATTIVISDISINQLNVEGKIDYFIRIPQLGEELNWFLGVIAFQLLTHQLCKELQIDPDRPRNLAKTVTVG